MDYTVVITAKDEPATVKKLVREIESRLSKLTSNFEVLIVCPDKKTKSAAISEDKLEVVKWLKDKGKGKPSALNLAFENSKSEILILTDGDVSLGEGALEELVKEFDCRDNFKIIDTDRLGLITGRPVPINPRNNIFGFWSHFLTTAAHKQRLNRVENNQYLDASGYLLAVRKELVSPMPENILVDDAWLSRLVWSQGYKVGYIPEAKVKVKFPTSFSDWVTQKKRTTSGSVQLEGMKTSVKQMRGFFQEVKGLRLALTYPKSIKEYFWMFLLILARFYVWLAVFWDRKIIKKPYSGNWKRIESTK